MLLRGINFSGYNMIPMKLMVVVIDYTGGIAKSKLSPALFDRLAGTTVTARNCDTVQKLAQISGTA